METKTEFPIFMGVCESALIRGEGFSQDFYGVGNIVPMPYFPQSLQGLLLLIGLPKRLVDQNKFVNLILSNEADPKSKANTGLTPVTGKASGQTKITGFARHYPHVKSWGAKGKDISARLLLHPEVPYQLMPVPCPPLFVREPSRIDVTAVVDDNEKLIGCFNCAFCEPAPISVQERAAIMSRPGAVSGLVYVLNCNKCKDEIQLRDSLDTSRQPPEKFKGSIALSDAPDKWRCKCGESEISLVYLKKGFHDMFRRIDTVSSPQKLQHTPMYGRGAIAAIMREYQDILQKHEADEGAVQRYLEGNPVLWHFLAPAKIWKKPPILTKYNADFAILTCSNVLYFVEIEKPATKLIKKDGGVHSELQGALDQIRNWKIEIGKRREAVLDAIGLAHKDVHDIRYMLIAGMACKSPMSGLEKLRSMSMDADVFFCFDELTPFLYSIETALLSV